MPSSHQIQATHKTQSQQPLHMLNDGSIPATASQATPYLQEHSLYHGQTNPDIGVSDSASQSNFPQTYSSGGTENSNINSAHPAPSQHPAQTYHTPSNPSSPLHPELPPLKPVFGVSLEDLFNRDGSAVPMLVHQCLQAVDLFGLEVEGIYRTSGTASHVSKLRAIFNNGKSFSEPDADSYAKHVQIRCK